MHDVTHPHHHHEHRVWVVPDSTLGRGSAFVFGVALAVAVGAPLIAWTMQALVAPGSGTPWFFLLWGTTLVALLVAIGAAAVTTLALVRDHALLLAALVVVTLLGVGALVTTDGVLS